MLKREDVLHVAKLSRLALAEKEVEKFSKQLAAVFDLFGKVDGADLKNIKETSQVTGLKNVLRADEIKKIKDLTDCTTEELLQNAPAHDEHNIVVPKVIEGK